MDVQNYIDVVHTSHNGSTCLNKINTVLSYKNEKSKFFIYPGTIITIEERRISKK